MVFGLTALRSFFPQLPAQVGTRYSMLSLTHYHEKLSLTICVNKPHGTYTHTCTCMHAMSCSPLPEFTSHSHVSLRAEKGGNRLMHVSELGRSAEEGSDFLLFVVSVWRSHLLHGSCGDLDRRQGEGGNRRAALSGRRVMEDWKATKSSACAPFLTKRSASITNTQRAEGGLVLMNPQVSPPLSRCGTLGYL